MMIVPRASDNANYHNRNDNDQDRGDYWHDQVEVGENDFEGLLRREGPVSDFARRRNGT